MVTFLKLYHLPEYVLLFCGILEKEKNLLKKLMLHQSGMTVYPTYSNEHCYFLPQCLLYVHLIIQKKTTIFECALTGIMYDIFHFTKQYQKKRMRCTCFCSSLYTLYRIRICCGVQQTMKAVRTTTNILITYRTEGRGSFREARVNKLTNRSLFTLTY